MLIWTTKYKENTVASTAFEWHHIKPGINIPQSAKAAEYTNYFSAQG